MVPGSGTADAPNEKTGAPAFVSRSTAFVLPENKSVPEGVMYGYANARSEDKEGKAHPEEPDHGKGLPGSPESYRKLLTVIELLPAAVSPS